VNLTDDIICSCGCVLTWTRCLWLVDFALLRNGFPAESIKDGRVLVVKTHESGETARVQFQKAILLVRKPSESILAEFNRRAAGHVGHAGRDKYTRNAGRCKSHSNHPTTSTYKTIIENTQNIFIPTNICTCISSSNIIKTNPIDVYMEIYHA
jgi:hypothetical protein